MDETLQGLSEWLRGRANEFRNGSFIVTAEKVERWASEVEAARAALPAPLPDLHAAIMNLPQRPPDSAPPDWAWHDGYKIGHRDARHAAAELASARHGADNASPRSDEKESDTALLKESMEALTALVEWVRAVPQDTPLPAMPGYDGDALAATLAKLRERLS